jgi:hypothetical protein
MQYSLPDRSPSRSRMKRSGGRTKTALVERTNRVAMRTGCRAFALIWAEWACRTLRSMLSTQIYAASFGTHRFDIGWLFRRLRARRRALFHSRHRSSQQHGTTLRVEARQGHPNCRHDLLRVCEGLSQIERLIFLAMLTPSLANSASYPPHQPPSTPIAWPVTKPASSEAR